MISKNVTDFISSIPPKNAYGEKITVVGAVKTRPCEVIRQAVNAGLTDIGENKVQEFIEKYDNYPKAANLHFIGHLQTNKLKYIIGKTELIQSCDSEKLANKISEAAKNLNITQNVLLEVNVGKEPQKYGFMPDELFDAYEKIRVMPNIKIQGLMTVLPKADEKEIRQLCLQMRELYDIIKQKDGEFKFLSMGMSEDYKIAIDSGSNMLRIGRSIFGERIYNQKTPV